MKTNVCRMALLLLSLFVLTTNVEAKKKKYPNGDVYEGKWKKGAPEGQGKLTKLNGEWYEGVWHEGFLTEGECHLTNGVVFRGTWTDGMQHFQGSLTTAKSDVYEGEGMWERWYSGTGKGKITYASGAIYEGSWQQLNKHGQGVLFDTSDDQYRGEWKYDKLDEGECLRSNGVKEEGSWSGMSLYRGKRQYRKDGIQFFETVSGGLVTETKQILPSDVEYWPKEGKMSFTESGSSITVTGLSSSGNLTINHVNYYDVSGQSDSIVFTGQGMDTFAIAKGTPTHMAQELRDYYTIHKEDIQRQYAEQKAKEEREARELHEAQQKVYADMIVGQTYKTNDAQMDDAGTRMFLRGMSAKLEYSFAFKAGYEVVVGCLMNVPASVLRSSYELMILKSKMDRTETCRYDIDDGKITIYDPSNRILYQADIKNNGGYLEFNDGLMGSVINVKGNKPTVASKSSAKGNGWAGRRYRSDKVIFANKSLAKQYDTNMFTVVPTFTIQFDSDTEATLITTVELKKKPSVSLSQEQWNMLTKEAQQHVTSDTQTYSISNGRLKMRAETFRIVGNGQSLVNDSPDFKGTVLRRIE